MNRWGKIVWSLSLFATLGWLASGAFGFQVVDGPTLARHTLIAFSALLALALTQVWIGVNLVVFERLVRSGAGVDERRRLAVARRRGVAAAAICVAAVVAQFTIANALYPASLAVGWHSLGGLVSAAAVLVALGLERRALRDVGALASALSAAKS